MGCIFFVTAIQPKVEEQAKPQPDVKVVPEVEEASAKGWEKHNRRSWGLRNG